MNVHLWWVVDVGFPEYAASYLQEEKKNQENGLETQSIRNTWPYNIRACWEEQICKCWRGTLWNSNLFSFILLHHFSSEIHIVLVIPQIKILNETWHKSINYAETIQFSVRKINQCSQLYWLWLPSFALELTNIHCVYTRGTGQFPA